MLNLKIKNMIFVTIIRSVGKKLNKKDLLSNTLATKKGYCTQRMVVCVRFCHAHTSIQRDTANWQN